MDRAHQAKAYIEQKHTTQLVCQHHKSEVQQASKSIHKANEVKQAKVSITKVKYSKAKEIATCIARTRIARTMQVQKSERFISVQTKMQ